MHHKIIVSFFFSPILTRSSHSALGFQDEEGHFSLVLHKICNNKYELVAEGNSDLQSDHHNSKAP